MDQGAKGNLVKAVGMGNMNVDARGGALSKGVPVIIPTRMYNGRIYPLYFFQGGGKTTFLSLQKARLLLVLMLH